MIPQLLPDTHILVRWLINPRKLSWEQRRVIQAAERRNQPVAVSAMSLVEIAILEANGKPNLKGRLEEFFSRFDARSDTRGAPPSNAPRRTRRATLCRTSFHPRPLP